MFRVNCLQVESASYEYKRLRVSSLRVRYLRVTSGLRDLSKDAGVSCLHVSSLS